MTSPWLNSDSERQAAALLADDRPAWIWASEDERLVWRNRAALAYEASHRRAAGERLVPVARQIPRAIRLGVPNRPSRARLQFTLGRKPISETCTCTPLLIEGGPPALLVVMADKVSDAEMALIAFDADSLRPFAGGAAHFVLTGADGSVLASGGDGRARLTARQKPALELPAGAGQSRFAIFPEAAAEAEIPPVPAPAAPPIEALVPDETAMVLQQAAARTAGGTQVAQAASDTEDGGSKLSSLLDRLDSSQVLYQPLDDSDDGILAPPQADAPQADAVVEPQGKRIPEPELASPPLTAAAAAEMGAPTEPRPVAPAASERRDDGNTDEAETGGGEDSVPVRLWRVIGRGFTPRGGESVSTEGFGTTRNRDTSFAAHAGDDGQQAGPFGDSHERTFRKDGETTTGAGDRAMPSDTARLVEALTANRRKETKEAATAPDEPSPARSNDEVERASRYNFDELSRILNDRVSSDSDARPEMADPAVTSAGAGALVNLGDENLILNRLPIGLLVFRDQQILFSNRALSDLLGHVDGSSLRRAGLSGVFPNDGEQSSAGPVTRLMGADGRMVSVSARLQTITWQNRPALLLSASRQQEPLNAEDLARSFAELMANALECGYFETSRSGVLTSVSGRAAIIAKRSPDSLIGRPLLGLIGISQNARLRGFLEQPARSAGVERPMMRFAGSEPGSEVILFAEGMAGIVTGYFGLLRKIERSAEVAKAADEIDPHFLIRLGRAVRQPVNAIIGFSELMRNQIFGAIGSDRYADYIRFIHSAGQDVASVVDELENYARLNDAGYQVEGARIDLVDLLEASMARVRPFAGSVRVLVRSGISSSLPGITADRETLSQALLNILSSAIAHSPRGGQVVLSAQRRSDGAVEVHVRDSGTLDATDMDDRFVVFRDGHSADGEALAPIPSTIGLALTQSLLAVNSASLDFGRAPGGGTLVTLVLPAAIVDAADSAQR